MDAGLWARNSALDPPPGETTESMPTPLPEVRNRTLFVRMLFGSPSKRSSLYSSNDRSRTTVGRGCPFWDAVIAACTFWAIESTHFLRLRAREVLEETCCLA